MKELRGGKSEVVRQRTLKNAIHCSGVGVHSGDKVCMALLPAPPGTGIVFRRTDITGGGRELRATWENAVETPLCTTIAHRDGVKIATVEHLMAALYGCSIDNAIIEISGAEVPIMDGSAAPFVFLIECAGVVEQDAPRRALRLLKPVTIEEPHRWASLAPNGATGCPLTVQFEIDFETSAIARQKWSTPVSDAVFKREISRARTFGFLHEVDQLRAMGFARGGSLDNAIVISGDRILNDGGLRFENEFVRHKVLDSIGDLYLVGAPIVGHFHGVRAGHSLTLRLLKAVMADASAWEWVTLTKDMVSGQPRKSDRRQDEAHGPSAPPIRAVAASA